MTTRRAFLTGLIAASAAGLSACSSMSSTYRSALGYAFGGSSLSRMYGAVEDNGRVIPAVSPSVLKERNIRRPVAWTGREEPGTIVVDPENHYLFLIQDGNRAMRYGVGVGKAGFAFQGRATIQRKADWPGWTPTQNMIRREPDRYGPYAGGLPGGLNNPLGARALYLYRDGRDTLYRIHGTNEPHTIGMSVSSGCIRMMNQDVIDLESRVPVGATVVVRSGAASQAMASV